MDTISSEIPTESSTDKKNGVLSKRALKKLQKKEKWLKYKPIKRAKEKAKLREKKELARKLNIDLGPSRKQLKLHKMSTSSCKIRVALDFSFDDLMVEKDLHKCINQLNHCYSINRKCENPMQFYVTNFTGKSKSVMQKHNGYANWDVFFHSESYMAIFRKDELIYLTSESENVVTNLEESKVYIIGALVDHNSQKGLTLKIAEEKGIGHARLPIDEFIQMKSRRVLTIDHVFEILLNVASCKMSWKEAFLKVIPQRKGVQPKDKALPGSNDDDEVPSSAKIADENILLNEKDDQNNKTEGVNLALTD